MRRTAGHGTSAPPGGPGRAAPVPVGGGPGPGGGHSRRRWDEAGAGRCRRASRPVRPPALTTLGPGAAVSDTAGSSPRGTAGCTPRSRPVPPGPRSYRLGRTVLDDRTTPHGSPPAEDFPGASGTPPAGRRQGPSERANGAPAGTWQQPPPGTTGGALFGATGEAAAGPAGGRPSGPRRARKPRDGGPPGPPGAHPPEPPTGRSPGPPTGHPPHPAQAPRTRGRDTA